MTTCYRRKTGVSTAARTNTSLTVNNEGVITTSSSGSTGGAVFLRGEWRMANLQNITSAAVTLISGGGAFNQTSNSISSSITHSHNGSYALWTVSGSATLYVVLNISGITGIAQAWRLVINVNGAQVASSVNFVSPYTDAQQISYTGSFVNNDVITFAVQSADTLYAIPASTTRVYIYRYAPYP